MFKFLNISCYTISHALWCDVAGIRTTFKRFILKTDSLRLKKCFGLIVILHSRVVKSPALRLHIPPDYSDINSKIAAFLFALLAYFLTFYTANKITQQPLEECRGLSESELRNTCCSPSK